MNDARWTADRIGYCRDGRPLSPQEALLASVAATAAVPTRCDFVQSRGHPQTDVYALAAPILGPSARPAAARAHGTPWRQMGHERRTGLWLRRLARVALGALLMLGGCDWWPGLDDEEAEVAADARVAGPAAEVLVRESRGAGTICRRFAREVAQAAVDHPSDAEAFLRSLQQEFTAGAGDPLALKEGLEQGRWNQAFFYGGHGGFRAPFDDDRAAYRDGGNHQPGHFVSVLSVATRLGADQARLALAVAGDYDPEQVDDLRLSEVAIRLGAGLADSTFVPADVARATRRLCR